MPTHVFRFKWELEIPKILLLQYHKNLHYINSSKVIWLSFNQNGFPIIFIYLPYQKAPKNKKFLSLLKWAITAIESYQYHIINSKFFW
jgi:hypothetical protein